MIMLITGTSRGIGRYLAEYYTSKGHKVIGCSRLDIAFKLKNYKHFRLDISDEQKVIGMFSWIRKEYGKLNVLINNAGVASMNLAMLTDVRTIKNVFNVNVLGNFIMCRESVKLMKKGGRIVNFSSVAIPFNLEGESVYASSKSAIESLTKIMAREFVPFNITVNAIGPNPIQTDLIKGVRLGILDKLIKRQAIKRYGKLEDISNVIDFFIRPESNFITGQIIYLGGVS